MEVKTLILNLRTLRKSAGKFGKGEHPVCIRISQGKDNASIPLKYSSSIENWDEDNSLPKPSHPHYKDLVKRIINYLDDITFEVTLAKRSGKVLSSIEVKRQVLKNNDPGIKSRFMILELFDKVINELEADENPGYADVFKSTRSTVSKLLNNNQFIPPGERQKEKDRSFAAFTKEDHQKYERLVSNNASTSTISHYLRTYYRIWNLAIKEGYCKREEHPSNFIKFHAYQRIKTCKRSIKQDLLQQIINIEFAPSTRIYRSHLLLQFMYYARGINFGDMCKLKRRDIVNGTIHYVRSKNHREYDYTLHPKAMDVVEYFKTSPQQSDAGYLFPIINSAHNTPRKIDIRIHSTLKDFNEDLKAMAESTGRERAFTSNSIRHAFATHLRNNNVTISIIKDALGHETESQTG